MAKVQSIEKPARWDLPFSRDLPNDAECRDMTDQDIERLLSIEPFGQMDQGRFPSRLQLDDILRNDTRIRHYRDGDVVVRQGDYGNAAFLILKGEVRIILEGLGAQELGRTETKRSVLGSLARLIFKPRLPEVRDARQYPQMNKKKTEPGSPSGQKVFVQDVTNVVDLLSSPEVKIKDSHMEQGDLFGELSALGRMPRTATVVAVGETELLEIRWQGLRDLRKYDKNLKQHVDEQYRRFGLLASLRSCELLAKHSEKDLDKIAQAAEFETYGKFDWWGSYQKMRKKQVDPLSEEPIIAKQGDYPNGLILIRAGFARLTRPHGHGEQTVGYLGKGDLYGLEEMVHKKDALGSTLRAVGYVDVVRIPSATFNDLILPQMPKDLMPPPETPAPESSPEPHLATAPMSQPTEHAPKSGNAPSTADDSISTAMMEFLVENRFINGTSTMVIDLDRCTRCDDCVRACADGHENNPRFIRHGTTFDHYMVTNACMHCMDPVCMIGCPTGAIHRSEEGGEVVINDVTCIGCTACASSCPYNNIQMVEVRDRSSHNAIMVDPVKGLPIAKATKCDLCDEHHGGPACERACPHDALSRMNMKDLPALSQWLNR
jgi:Fe-S-cluster-containing dehydrogenase component/CRP-like cAMP-binding protein